jgi:hypothetical protein
VTLPQIAVEEAVALEKRRDDALMSPRERGVLVTLLRDIGARTVIEIGARDGRCAEIMLLNVPGISRYIGIDVPLHEIAPTAEHPDLPMEPGEYAKDFSSFELMVRPRGSLDLRREDLPTCDVMLIDGDHERASVEHDTALARACVRPGGLILWHDYYLDADHMHRTYGLSLDVTAVLDEMAAAGEDIAHIEDTWLAMARQPPGKP